LLWNAFITSASSGILWTCILSAAMYICIGMFKDKLGRALIVAFSATLLAIVLLFMSTNAYAFLANETTIHRVLMQFSATAILIVTYGLSLKIAND